MAADKFGVPQENIDISYTELSAALREANKDLYAIQARRHQIKGATGQSFKGISEGKIAGVLCFRLNRYRIVNIISNNIEPRNETDLRSDRKAYKIQDAAIISYIIERILRAPLADASLAELLYIFSRRHINQEMLGVVFETMRPAAGH